MSTASTGSRPSCGIAVTRTVSPNPTDSQRKVLVELCRPALERGGGAASNREIAAALYVSVETVKTHMRALFDAFDVGDVPQYHKRSELVRRALESGGVGCYSQINQLEHLLLTTPIRHHMNLFLAPLHKRADRADGQQSAGRTEEVTHGVNDRTACEVIRG
jgi:DNA-binding CsgD family transcriptional regulator